ncbi:NAD(P)-dependent oxidoreductase [Alteribacillus sp. HJP-4]|uniref:NAD(P)-dependent oxidoreductase n=1 Tax=Alteribacillus sp. HJP-4 TaxID=2775394 RepID=UPI0035CD3A87
MKVLILGDYENVHSSSSAALRLTEKGWEVQAITEPVKPADVPGLASGTDAIVLVRERTALPEDIIAQLSHVRLISQTGKGTAHLDREALNQHHIELTTTPGGSADSVVELTIGMMIGAARQFPIHQASFQEGEWIQTPGIELHGKQLGILGFGAIGKKVAAAAQALGMKVKVWRPTGTDGTESRAGVEAAALEEVLSTSDVTSLHMRLTPEWKGFLHRGNLELMKKEAIFVNTSRGAFVDEYALAEMLESGRLRGAGLDVFIEEPLQKNPFASCQNVLLTPHIGYITTEVLKRFAENALTNVENYFES